MARLKRGILGGGSGKVGNIVMTSWKGIDVARTQPINVANPKTAAQQTQRNSFASAVAFAQRILTNVIKPQWDRFVQEQSGFNAWISANVSEFDQNGLQSPQNAIMSRGNLADESIDSISPDTSANDVSVDWTSSGGQSSDVARCVVYNEATGDVVAQNSTTTRSNGRIDSAVLPNGVTGGDTIHAWLMFRSDSGDAVSDSTYMSATA